MAVIGHLSSLVGEQMSAQEVYRIGLVKENARSLSQRTSSRSFLPPQAEPPLRQRSH